MVCLRAMQFRQASHAAAVPCVSSTISFSSGANGRPSLRLFTYRLYLLQPVPVFLTPRLPSSTWRAIRRHAWKRYQSYLHTARRIYLLLNAGGRDGVDTAGVENRCAAGMFCNISTSRSLLYTTP